MSAKRESEETQTMSFQGVLPAITTPFNADLTVDHGLLRDHCRWLVDCEVDGIVPAGSLGESATLSAGEKRQIFETCVGAVEGRVPVVPGIAALSTRDAVALAEHAAATGCRGLMVLPPYVYSSDWREMRAHVAAVMEATDLPCMLYNNPIAYRTDFVPEQLQELARDFPNLCAVKESSADVRRITAIRALSGTRLDVLVGVDDALVEGVDAGATGWIAGLANAFPVESVALYRLAKQGRKREAEALYRWFLPLLRMDTVPKLVQLIKLAQARVDRGRVHVRPPRLPLVDDELREALGVIELAVKTRPRIAA